MNPQDQIKAIAELDDNSNYKFSFTCAYCNQTATKDYLHSRDAIIPVIEKQDYHAQIQMIELLTPSCNDWSPKACVTVMIASAPQLCEALLRATGKWTE